MSVSNEIRYLIVLHMNAISDERKDKPTFIYPKLALEIKFLNLIKTPSYLGK